MLNKNDIEKLKLFDKKFEYLYFSRAYFWLAILGVEEVKKKMSGAKVNKPFIPIIPDWVSDNNYLLIPVFLIPV